MNAFLALARLRIARGVAQAVEALLRISDALLSSTDDDDAGFEQRCRDFQDAFDTSAAAAQAASQVRGIAANPALTQDHVALSIGETRFSIPVPVALELLSRMDQAAFIAGKPGVHAALDRWMLHHGLVGWFDTTAAVAFRERLEAEVEQHQRSTAAATS